MKILTSLFLLFAFYSAAVNAGPTITVSNSAEEVTYSYEMTFRSLAHVDQTSVDSKSLADFHAIHLYGIFQSAEYVRHFDLSPELYEGFAGTHYPEVISANKIKKAGDSYYWIHYKARGKMLVLKPILKKWLGTSRAGVMSLPLLYNFPLIYLDDMSGYHKKSFKKCTDPYYPEPKDFSYFYTPYLCSELSQEPLAESIDLHVARVNTGLETPPIVPLKAIRADNGNGKLTVLYFIYGFDGDLTGETDIDVIHRDAGWKLYRSLHKDLEDNYNFKNIENTDEFRSLLADDQKYIKLITPVALTHNTQRRFFSTHIRKDGDQTIIVRSALFNTENEVGASPLLSFPKFWKESWENGDFIYYGGHSGDGASLNIDGMLNNLGTADIKNIHFQKNKTQIAFMDACSSYAHFLDMYNELKPNNLHLISYGVVSLYHLAKITVESTIRLLLTGQPNMTWENALKEIESDQLTPHIEFLYGQKAAPQIIESHLKNNELPSLLLNVSAPR